MTYNHLEVEKKWQEYWDKNKTFYTDVWDFSKPKFYALDMFPYPSGQGLHVGHPEGYTATDIISRMKRMQGYNVLHPMGWDAFGLPAEQYAIKTGNHPAKFTETNINTFKKQLKMLGLSFDWDKEISTCDPEYYKWTQWIFKQLYNDGLAKIIEMPVNWCEELGCVLSNDEVIDGKSERGGFPVIRKNMKQWVLDIPKYAEILLEGLENIDWPESTKEIQRNWIGRSEGAEIKFKIVGSNNLELTVFTTRPDTIFGATYCVISPEHELISQITTNEQKKQVEEYIRQAAMKSDLERTELNKEKTGVFTGSYAINPINNKEIPIWTSDYVLSSYGTGCIMAVPAHDERDFAFAKKFELPIIQVIATESQFEKINNNNMPIQETLENELKKFIKKQYSKENIEIEQAFTGDGILVNSAFLNRLSVEDAKKKVIEYLEENRIGKKKINYKLREWIFARQRYWGEPIPIVYLDNGMKVLEDSDLPLILPELEDYAPSKTGASPLDKATEWVNTTFEGRQARRETSTMPGSAGSSWYFLRYIDSKNKNEIANKKLLEHWMPVDLYMGGTEHAVGHLLYSRFWNNYLYQKGIVPVKEPFIKIRHQGMILGPNGEKMSKSKGNVINPDDMVKEYGADALRIYEMFMGPIDATKPWDPNGIEGSRKFLERVWRLYVESGKVQNKENKNLEKIYHYTVKKVTNDYETMAFNTAISQMMIFINSIYKQDIFPIEYAEGFLKLLNPIAPHITEEIWCSVLGHTNTISYEPWPKYDESKIIEEKINIPVQVNGKLKTTIEIDLNEEENSVKEKVHKVIKEILEEKTIIKEIYVKNKIYNVVIK